MSPIALCANVLSPAGPRARLSVLIFHRVLPGVDPLFPGEVDAIRFDNILRWVTCWFNVISLSEAVDRLVNGELPARALAITFDDGYADNHDIALPILSRHNMPATFFVASDFLDGGRMWNDTVIEAIRQTKRSSIEVESLGLGRLSTNTLEERRGAIDALLKQIKHKPPAERQLLTNEISRQCECDLPDDLMMTSDQLRHMQTAGMTIGGHTCSHPILSAVENSVAQAEILTNRLRLEKILGQTVDLFAYPNGKPGEDFKAEHVKMVRAAGFKAAVTTAPGTIRNEGDMFQIPRFTPWDHSRLRFGIRLVGNMRKNNF